MGNGNQEPDRHRRTAVRPAMVRSLIPASRRFRSGHSGQRMIGCRASGPISAGHSSLVTSRSMRPDLATLRGMPSRMVEIRPSCAVTARRRARHFPMAVDRTLVAGTPCTRRSSPRTRPDSLPAYCHLESGQPAYHRGHGHRPPPRTPILATGPGPRCHCQLRCGTALARARTPAPAYSAASSSARWCSRPQGFSDSDPRLNRVAFDAGCAKLKPTQTSIFRPPASDPQAWSTSSSRSPRDERGHHRSRPLQGSIGRGSPWSTRRRRPR